MKNTLKQSRRALAYTQRQMADALEINIARYRRMEAKEDLDKAWVIYIDAIMAKEGANPSYGHIWTGEEATALHDALNCSGSEFGRMVGVTRQTVNLWKNHPQYKPGIKPSLELDKIKASLETT